MFQQNIFFIILFVFVLPMNFILVYHIIKNSTEMATVTAFSMFSMSLALLLVLSADLINL